MAPNFAKKISTEPLAGTVKILKNLSVQFGSLKVWIGFKGL